MLGLIPLTILLVFLTSCNGSAFRINEAPVESNHKPYSNIYIYQQDSYVTLCDAEHNTDEMKDARVISVRIHPDLPEFTFIRIIGDYVDTHNAYDIPSAIEVTIVIKDDSGALVQTISGLSQSHDFIASDITFDDYNFDDYLDIRLMRWQEGAAGLLAHEYFWLWDVERKLFVLNEQLVEIGHAAGMRADSFTSQIVVRQRVGGLSNLYFYEYYSGLYELVAHEYYSRVYEYGKFVHITSTHTNLVTGEIIAIPHLNRPRLSPKSR